MKIDGAMICERCNGEGIKDTGYCVDCEATGKVHKEIEVEV